MRHISRRVAQAALLIAAGAAPILGASAAHAAELPSTGLSGLSQPDLGGVAAKLPAASEGAGQAAGSAAQKHVPAVTKAAGQAAGTTAGTANKALGGTAAVAAPAAGEAVGQAAPAAAKLAGSAAPSGMSGPSLGGLSLNR